MFTLDNDDMQLSKRRATFFIADFHFETFSKFLCEINLSFIMKPEPKRIR